VTKYVLLCLSAVLALSGCTVHPRGEQEERSAAISEGEKLLSVNSNAEMVTLSDVPTSDELVRYALATNGEVEKAYWEWRSSIEQIPQDGTQASNLALFAGTSITDGKTSLETTTLGAGNDPMADIVLPSKLSAAAKRSLENARAAGQRFRKTQFEVRAKVLTAYTEYIATGEQNRLRENDTRLLETAVTFAEAQSQSGSGGQRELLKARNDLDLFRSEIESARSILTYQQAELNALLGRKPAAVIGLPTGGTREPVYLTLDDAHILGLAARENPELVALAHEVAAGKESVRLAKLQYLPDISLSALTNLEGTAQSLSGMVTIPLLRYEAIRAAVRQADANLQAAEAWHRQSQHNTASTIIQNLVLARDAERQLALLKTSVVPRAESLSELSRTAYETGQGSLTELLETQRSLIALRQLVVSLEASHAKAVAELEAAVARNLT
jgi:cobalt-zinc-cadmium efflux system outer membrane protein